jgi:ubiquinone/menaquinone biosynthesis C-methylase UbiE
MTNGSPQDKEREIAFFDAHAAADAYDVFLPATNERIIDAFVGLSNLPPGSRVVDLGCGSGIFTDVLQRRGYRCTGIDISPKLIRIAQTKFPKAEFFEGDVEYLPFQENSFDGILLSGLVHHFPDPSRCAAEVFRILRPGGTFFAFDPNRMNPFMYFYRDRTSPFYSSVGVTENERPVLAAEVAATFRSVGFRVGTEYLSDLEYRYVASGLMRRLLPLYNTIDSFMFSPAFMRRFSSFVLTFGKKPDTLQSSIAPATSQNTSL